jgi:hypothetical protein
MKPFFEARGAQGIVGARATVLCKDAYKIALQFFRSAFTAWQAAAEPPKSPVFCGEAAKNAHE